ncbi:hypothetical protein G5B35_10510 [Parapusillimonas sp. SGNA-6]|nr:hypothetical protein [Parapusillimonas sp. SGNA-6]
MGGWRLYERDGRRPGTDAETLSRIAATGNVPTTVRYRRLQVHRHLAFTVADMGHDMASAGKFTSPHWFSATSQFSSSQRPVVAMGAGRFSHAP